MFFKSKNILIYSLIAGAGYFFISSLCVAEEKIPKNLEKRYERRREEMTERDLNKDGMLQVEELVHTIQGRFASADEDHDGEISSREKDKAVEMFQGEGSGAYNDSDKKQNRIDNRFKNADINNDKKISRKEYQNYFINRYQSFDRDGNGIITEKEYRTDVEKLPKKYLDTE